MKRLVSILKSKVFLTSLGMILLIGLILVLGMWLEWSLTVQLIAIIGVLVVCIVFLGISFARANRSASEIESSIKMQAEKQIRNSRPDRQEEVRQLQERLEKAINTLKQSKLGKGSRGRAALYALPWYMFIGPPGAGKTTAISNSGLNFPLGSDRVKGVGGTRNCDWFFSDSAILLDTAGRYMSEQEDTDEWYAFLETLVKHRTERPINGVIVGISLADLAGASAYDIETHADDIRRRIDELIKRLGVRFPVYLVFTKCDLLQGFVEFFGDMSRREREQIWGTTFEQDAADRLNTRVLFEREYQLLSEALVNMRTARLAQSMKREERRKVYIFPLEFAGVRDELSTFVNRLFLPNPYQETPIFRGFYFTSGTQEGAPIDRVIRSIAGQFNLPATAPDTPESTPETKSYFINRLFTDVVIPDQYLVQRTSKAANRGRFMQAGVAAGAAVALCLFVFAAFFSVVRTQNELTDLSERVQLVQQVSWDDGPARAAENIHLLNDLKDGLELIERRTRRPNLLRLGLQRGADAVAPTREIYNEQLRRLIADHTLYHLERRMATVAASSNLQVEDREQLNEDLKAYLLLTSEIDRLSAENNRLFLREYLSQVIAEEILVRVAASDRQMYYEMLSRQVGSFVDALEAGTTPAFSTDRTLVLRVRNQIYEQPSIQGLYTRIRQEGLLTLPEYTLADVLQHRNTSLFRGEPEISQFYTKEGYERFVRPEIEEVSEDPTRDDWVMGRDSEEAPAFGMDRESMIIQLEDIYFAEYAQHWQRFLRAAQIRPIADIREAALSFEQLSDPVSSPILYLLAQAAFQTRFAGEGLLEDASGQLRGQLERRVEGRVRGQTGLSTMGLRGAAGEEGQHPVDRRFAALHDLNAIEAATGGSPALDQALQSLARVSGRLSELAGSDASAAADYAARILTENGGELASELRSIQSALGRFDTDLRRSLFEQPVLYAWDTILTLAQRYLNERWAGEVCVPFDRMFSGRFPFDQTAGQEAMLVDVESFFDPQSGRAETFFENELSPFLDRDMQRTRNWEGRGIQVSNAVLNTRQDAERIAGGLFQGGVLRVEFELQPETPLYDDGAQPVSQYYLSVHGRDLRYEMGRPSYSQLVWPGTPHASLRITTREGERPPLSFDGEWAWFRLLGAGSVTRRTSTEFDVRWSFPPGITARYEMRTRSAATPFAGLQDFFSFSCPGSLN